MSYNLDTQIYLETAYSLREAVYMLPGLVFKLNWFGHSTSAIKLFYNLLRLVLCYELCIILTCHYTWRSVVRLGRATFGGGRSGDGESRLFTEPYIQVVLVTLLRFSSNRLSSVDSGLGLVERIYIYTRQNFHENVISCLSIYNLLEFMHE